MYAIWLYGTSTSEPAYCSKQLKVVHEDQVLTLELKLVY